MSSQDDKKYELTNDKKYILANNKKYELTNGKMYKQQKVRSQLTNDIVPKCMTLRTAKRLMLPKSIYF